MQYMFSLKIRPPFFPIIKVIYNNKKSYKIQISKQDNCPQYLNKNQSNLGETFYSLEINVTKPKSNHKCSYNDKVLHNILFTDSNF